MYSIYELALALMLSGFSYQMSTLKSRREARYAKVLVERHGKRENNETRRLRKNSDNLIGWQSSVGFLVVWILFIPSPLSHVAGILQILLGGPMAFFTSLLVWGVVSHWRLSHFDKHDEFAGAGIIGFRDGRTHVPVPVVQVSNAKGSAHEISAAGHSAMIDPDANRGIGA